MLLQALQMDGEANSLVYHDFETTAGARTPLAKAMATAIRKWQLCTATCHVFGKHPHLVAASSSSHVPTKTADFGHKESADSCLAVHAP